MKAITDDIIYGRTALREGLPWITPGAIAYLNTIIKPTWRVFEWGSGGSSVYFVSHCAEYVAIEHDANWITRTRDLLTKRGFDPYVVNLVKPDPDGEHHAYADAILDFPDNSFDLISVDGEATSRKWCIPNCMPKIKPGGWLMLDNSNWYEDVTGWQRQDFIVRNLHWVGQADPFDWWTSFFQKPE